MIFMLFPLLKRFFSSKSSASLNGSLARYFTQYSVVWVLRIEKVYPAKKNFAHFHAQFFDGHSRPFYDCSECRLLLVLFSFLWHQLIFVSFPSLWVTRYDILGVKIAYRETVNLVQMKAVDIAFDDRVTQQRLILQDQLIENSAFTTDKLGSFYLTDN